MMNIEPKINFNPALNIWLAAAALKAFRDHILAPTAQKE